MTDAIYIKAAYIIALGLPALLSIQALLRLRTARRRLRALSLPHDRQS